MESLKYSYYVHYSNSQEKFLKKLHFRLTFETGIFEEEKNKIISALLEESDDKVTQQILPDSYQILARKLFVRKK